MNAKEIIEKLRLTFNELVAPVAVANPIQLMDATLSDGTAIQITEMIVGGIVTINGTPAPTGEYELSDGTYLMVGDNGAITEIKQDVATEAPAPAPMQDEIGNKFSVINEKFASYEEKFSAYEQRFSDYEARLNKATQVIEGLLNLTQTLAETPTGIPDASIKSSSSFAEEKKVKSYDILFS
jgi:hypothetical protein